MKCYVPGELMGKAEALLNKQARVLGVVSSSAPDTITVRDLRPAHAV